MNYDDSIVEYYDELFPVSPEQSNFYLKLSENYSSPAKFLRIGCGCGTFEHNLSKNGFDVTGIDDNKSMIESANRKRRTQLMFLRFFYMTTLEMGRFLGKGFYNIISFLDNQLSFISDAVLIDKFFFDVKSLLSKDGVLVLQLCNYEKFEGKKEIILPKKSSIRATLSPRIVRRTFDGALVEEMFLKAGDHQPVKILEDQKVYPVKRTELEQFAKKNGFSSIQYYADFSLKPFENNCDFYIAVIK